MNETPCSNQEIHMLFEHGFELENTKNEPCIICIMLYMESIVDQTVHFADSFARENVAKCYGVVTFKHLQLTPFCLEKSTV